MIVDDVELDIKYKYVLVNETPKLSALHSKLGLSLIHICFRLLQAGRNRHRSRQDDESAGSGNCCRTYATVQRISDDMEKRSRRGA